MESKWFRIDSLNLVKIELNYLPDIFTKVIVMKVQGSVCFLLLLLAVFICGDVNSQGVRQGDDQDNIPTGKGYGVAAPSVSPGPILDGYQIQFHGGPLMVGPTPIYYIWYGDWTKSPAANGVLRDLATHIGDSALFATNNTYHDQEGQAIKGPVFFAGEVFDDYSKGKSLSDKDVESIVQDALTRSALPEDPNGIYFVLTSSDVDETTGFCNTYCGWHSHMKTPTSHIKYAFVGDTERCPASCQSQPVGPNGKGGGDGVANILVKELLSTTSDPELSAWYDGKGRENGDLCDWTFGNTYLVNNAKANMKIGARDFLLQQNWVNQSGAGCQSSP